MEQHIFLWKVFVDIADTSSNDDEYKRNNALGLTAFYFLIQFIIRGNNTFGMGVWYGIWYGMGFSYHTTYHTNVAYQVLQYASWYSLLYNFPPNCDLLRNNSYYIIRAYH